jgi:uncharacterized membrane protein
MPVIERSIRLNVPLEAAYRYLINPAHLPEFCLNLDAVTNVEHINARCIHFLWKYRMCGVHFEGRAEITDTQHQHRADIRFWGGILGTAVWMTQRLDDGIQLTATIDYRLPAPLLRKHSEIEITEHNEHAVERMLEHFKALLESQETAETAI